MQHVGRLRPQHIHVLAKHFDHDLAVDLRNALEHVVANRLREARLDAGNASERRVHLIDQLILRQAARPLRLGGFTSTKNSAMLIILGSVPSSGRPDLDTTVTTSGNCRSDGADARQLTATFRSPRSRLAA